MKVYDIYFGQVTQNRDNSLLADDNSTTRAGAKWVPAPFYSDIYEKLEEITF